MPANIEPLATAERQIELLRRKFRPLLAKELADPAPTCARAAYVAICLDEGKWLQRESPEAWAAAMAELQKFPELLKCVFELPTPQGDALRKRAREAGLMPLVN